jgi:hypothetical protein
MVSSASTFAADSRSTSAAKLKIIRMTFLKKGRLQRWPDAIPGPDPVGRAGGLPASSPWVVRPILALVFRDVLTHALVGSVIIAAKRPIAWCTQRAFGYVRHPGHPTHVGSRLPGK